MMPAPMMTMSDDRSLSRQPSWHVGEPILAPVLLRAATHYWERMPAACLRSTHVWMAREPHTSRKCRQLRPYASASLTIFSTAARRSPDSGWRGMRTRSLVPMAKTSASLMFWTR